jgi:hypothetical protein
MTWMARLGEYEERAPAGWIVLACLGVLGSVLLTTLVVMCVEGFENTDRSEPWLLMLAASPVAAWAATYRLARSDWPTNPARLIAATSVSLAVVIAALVVRVFAGAGM